MNNKKLKIVTIGGGSGQYTLLSGLRDLNNIDITAIVSMADSGGSTGRLRDELGVLPPGDILKCLLALSPNREIIRQILQRRFKKNEKLNGHTVGNILLTMLSQYEGNFLGGINALGEILDVEGRVMPVTLDKVTLVAELVNGNRLYGETTIDMPKTKNRAKIKKTFLVPHHGGSVRVYPPVIDMIERAHYIIIGPGDLYTSITPNFLVPEVKKAITKTKAKLIYVANIMTKFGETNNFTGQDFVVTLEKFINRKIDKLIFNSEAPEEKILKKYRDEKADLVNIDINSPWESRQIIKKNLLSTTGHIVRHDTKKLTNLIKMIIR